jgi:CHAD domain-containing protein
MCAGAILDRVAAVRRQIGPVRKGRSTKAVHDMRVASRRLRAALALFEPCLPARSDRWRKGVRKVTRALGQARDLDVQMETVSSIRRRGRARWAADLKPLLEHLRSQRSSAQKKVTKAIRRMAAAGILEEIERSLADLAAKPPLPPPDWVKAYEIAADAITDLLGALEADALDLPRADAVEQHHAMRISAKHLRYSLEVFAPLYGKAIDAMIRDTRTMQTLLGDLHDCDVWVATLPDFLRQRLCRMDGQSRAAARLTAAVEAFRQDRIRRRSALHRRCLAKWQDWKRQHSGQALRRLVATPPCDTAPARRGHGGAQPRRRGRSRPAAS